MRTISFLGAAVAILVAVGLASCATTAKGPSDEDLVQAMLVQFKAAMEANDLDAVVAMCAEDLESEWGDKEGFVAFMEEAKGMGYLDGIEVIIEDAEIAVDGATATVSGIHTVTPMATAESSFTFGKGSTGWKVTIMEVTY